MLPCLALLCHALVISSTYDTLQTWSQQSSTFSALLSYVAVLGFAGVILFDSKGPNTLECNLHFVCVSGLALSVWFLHAKCLFELSRIITSIDEYEHKFSSKQPISTLGTRTRRNYTVVEIVYIIALTSFGVAFVYGIPMAIQLEYSVLLCVLALAVINAITFHMTYEYLFEYKRECVDTNTTADVTTHATGLPTVWIACALVSVVLVYLKLRTTATDYFHSISDYHYGQHIHH